MPRVVHFEVQAEDPQRAIAFYEKVLGWKFTKWEAGDWPYWMIETGPAAEPGINGGLLPRMGGTPTEGQSVNAYVCTVDATNVDQTVAAWLANGGVMAVPKMAIKGIGRLAYCKATEGNIFGIMQNDPSAA